MVKEQKVSLALVAVLFLAGVACVGLRYQWRSRTRVAPEDGVWRLTYKVHLEAKAENARMRVALPNDSKRNRVISQQLEHPRLRTLLSRGSRAENRTVQAFAAEPGSCELKGEFLIHVRPKAEWRDIAAAAEVSPDKRVRWLRGEPGIQPSDEVVKRALDQLRAEGGTPEEITQRIFDYTRHEIGQNDGRVVESATAIKTKRADPVGKARAMVALCRAAEIPSRLVSGFTLDPSQDAKPKVWVEARLGKRWVPFDPVAGYSKELPPQRVVVRRGGWRIVEAAEDEQLQTTFRIERTEPPEALRAPDRKSWTEIVDFTRLPLSMHGVLATLLLLPFGAVIAGLFRNIIGVRTFGTFAPILLALAFVLTDWQSGLLVLLVTLVGGLAVRHVLNYLKLLMVARLGVVLTMVVTCLVLGISTVEYLSDTPNPQLVILPMVILTGLVEQIYITSEEDNFRYTLKLILGTTLVGLCCFLVLSSRDLGRFVFRYPEVHLFTMGTLILIGRYAGYRLTELWRFHDLVRGKAGPTPSGDAPAAAGEASA